MSDIYVFGSNDNTNDYSTMGLVGALTPTECSFKEAANGESLVELTHPIDSFGRYTALQRGNILAVPVPVRTTPEIHDGQCVTTVWTYKVKPLNQLTSTAQRTLYMWRFSSAPIVAILNEGEEVTVVWKANEEEPVTGQEDIHPWFVKWKYGEGWIDPDALDLITTHSIEDDPAAIEEIQSPWTVTKQYFRIYETKKTIDAISVTARHISYDLLYNLSSYREGGAASLQEILAGVLGDCYAEHQFSAYTTLDGVQSGNYYDQRNPIDIFLNEDDGICKRFGVDLIRNNYSLYFMKNPGINRGVRIQYGKNMTGIGFTTSDDEVATRIIPVGEKEDGTKLYLNNPVTFPGVLKYGSRGNTVKELQSRLVSLGYSVGSTGIDGIFEWRTENGLNAFKANAGLPQDGIYDETTHEALMEALGVTSEPYIDSPRINDYPVIHVYELQCENCSVGQQEDGGGIVTEEIARARMKQQTEDLLESGCDLPKIEMSVEFINLGDTEEYKQFRNLENCFLYDYVIVQHPTMDVDVTAQIMEIEWDCLLDRMVSMEIGSVGKTLANTGITSWQIPNGFSGSKIAGGSIPGGALQSDIISVRHMQADSINTEALQAACVTAVKIAAGAIEASHISVEAIDAVLANIDTAVIEKAEINWADIASLSAQIAEISKAHLVDADINWANIDNLAAAVANIAKAHLTDADIQWADIENLNAVMADIIHQTVEVGEFSYAEIKNLLANALILEQGSAGSMTITNLIVTQANMLGAVIKKLVIPGEDGKYYEIVVGTDGKLTTNEVTVSEAEIAAGELEDGRQIVATTINAESINGTNITAQQAILNTVLTQALTAKKITAGEALIASATIPSLYTTSIEAIGNSLTLSANQKIEMIVSDIEGLDTRITATEGQIELLATKSEVEEVQEDADFATPYISDTPPDIAPAAGKLWIDEGQTPSVWRKWRGADITTDREYQETFEDVSDGQAAVTLQNGTGHIKEASVTMRCCCGLTGKSTIVYKAYIPPKEGSTANEYLFDYSFTPQTPLYGLSSAKDAVEISREGAITVIHKTGYIESYNGETIPGDYLSSTGVLSTGAQVVYALAAPESESLTPIPIFDPPRESITFETNSDEIKVVVYGSGWETVNDTEGIRGQIESTGNDLAMLAESLSLLESDVGNLSQQIITPEGIKNIVMESSEYKLLATTVEQAADGLTIARTDISSIEGRVENIESGVHISGSEIGFYKSDDPFRATINNRGFQVTENGQVNISIRENKTTTQTLKVEKMMQIGKLALASIDGHCKLMLFGG